jgi:hypothetical protein
VSLKRWLLFSVPAIVAILLIGAVATPSLRERVQNYFAKTGHDVLASAEGDLLGDGGMTKVIKYRSGDSLYVEILKMNETGGTTLVDRILLPDKHDGLFNYQGHVTRLAIADIDNDGKLELLAPTFDNQLVPHLNVFRYNSANSRFELYQPPK